jgi:hypothetical protein
MKPELKATRPVCVVRTKSRGKRREQEGSKLAKPGLRWPESDLKRVMWVGHVRPSGEVRTCRENKSNEKLIIVKSGKGPRDTRQGRMKGRGCVEELRHIDEIGKWLAIILLLMKLWYNAQPRWVRANILAFLKRAVSGAGKSISAWINRFLPISHSLQAHMPPASKEVGQRRKSTTTA